MYSSVVFKQCVLKVCDMRLGLGHSWLYTLLQSEIQNENPLQLHFYLVPFLRYSILNFDTNIMTWIVAVSVLSLSGIYHRSLNFLIVAVHVYRFTGAHRH